MSVDVEPEGTPDSPPKDSYEGTYRGLEWRIRYGGRDEKYYKQYGDISFSIPSDTNPCNLYYEGHYFEKTSIDELQERIESAIDAIHDEENVQQCEACGNLYNRDVKRGRYEQELSWADRHFFKHGIDPRYKRAESYEHAETCVYTSGWIFDTLHVITHFWETNPLYEDEELVACESLASTRGFQRVREDGEPRSFEELQEKYMEITRAQADGRDNREKKKEMLELMDWVLKREDRFYTSNRFRYRRFR